MRLTDDEKAMLDGAQGPAKQRAMDLLMRYGRALGAERLVEVNNVASTFNVTTAGVREVAVNKGFDAVFSEYNLDSDEVVEMPQAAAPTCQLIQGMDPYHPELNRLAPDNVELQKQSEAFFKARGVSIMATCAPYQVGNVPKLGEHCAWMESSAVVLCNSLFGARTNTEGRESTGAASITRRIPYWGYHLPENRLGTHLVDVEVPVEDMLEWGLLGYHVGDAVGEQIAVLRGIGRAPSMIMLKHFGAAGASSGGIEMYHVPGVTPEAPTLEAAFGGRAPRETLRYGAAERRRAYENLNASTSTREVDFVMLGCPHNSMEQLRTCARLLDGKRLNAGTAMWVFTPRALREEAQAEGLLEPILAAGAHVLSDTCPAISRLMPKGTKVACTDSAKQAHYLPPLTGVQCWFGAVDDCVRAGITGRWEGDLP
ncbi:aconitase X [Roseomonas sp. BN140053]|uniref:aconitase X n=1 Tax=Roseomonas sp. BN140053 TaxID=3391898 RepID=UPI0039ED8031